MERGRTHVSYQRNPNFCERIGSSLIGILVGIVLLVVAICLVFWNEGRAVQTAKSLDEGLNLVESVSPYVISMENDGKLIHFSAPLKTDQALEDSEYQISVQAVKLRRVVEMYQWEEHVTERKYDEGNGQTRVEKEYSYTQVWRSDVIRSNGFDDSFNHMNPSQIPVKQMYYEADRVNVGEYILSQSLKASVNNFVQMPLSKPYQGSSKKVQIYDNYYFHGYEPTRPQIGDIRVKFEYAGLSGESQLGSPTVVSIVARQIGSKLLPYQTLAGDSLELLYIGKLSAKEIFAKQKMQNTVVTWGIRFGGWLLMFIGFACLTSIVTTIVDWLPIVRDLVAMGVCLMNLSLSISLSLTVIAIGWIFYRPLLGIAILAMAATPFFVSRFRRHNPRSRID